jgi:chloramphenicol O-acetyltransferase type A
MNQPAISTYKTIDIDTWVRKDIYAFYRTYQDPFFHVTAAVDMTGLKQSAAKAPGIFFLSYLHAALTALNQTEALRLRFHAQGVVCYDTIHCGCTVMREDETFGFVFFPFYYDLAEFIEEAKPRLEAGKKAKGLIPLDARPDVAFFSVLPWIHFSSFKNAHLEHQNDAFSRIVFGKGELKDDRFIVPVAAEVNHALVDGLHLGQFYRRLENITGQS